MEFCTLKQLIEYCSICPVCTKNRHIDVTVGPDSVASLENDEDGSNDWIRLQHFEIGSKVKLLIVAHIKVSKYKLLFEIDTVTNNFLVTIPQLKSDNAQYNKSVDTASRPEFYFHLYASCKECGQSSLNTNDLIFDFKSKTLYNLGVDSEICILHDRDDTFDLYYDWAKDQIKICLQRDEDQKVMIDSEYTSSFSIPMTKLDFSDQDKLLKRLKTLHMFS